MSAQIYMANGSRLIPLHVIKNYNKNNSESESEL